MLPVERKQRIIEFVKQRQVASVSELAQAFQVHERRYAATWPRPNWKGC